MGAGVGVGLTGGGSGATATVVTWATACTGATGTTMYCFQYDTATLLCQKRGISNSSSVSWLTANAPPTLSGETACLQIQRPAKSRIAAKIAATM